jgi:N-acetylmuramoyl-L-alanine amidase
VSFWDGDADVNSRSIGIEICNPGHDFGYPDFPARQIAAVIVLCRGILMRNIIRPDHIVAHSDVAPGRKQDPGEKFPWKQLAQSGIGLWVEPAAGGDEAGINPGDSGNRVSELQKRLAAYGYGLEITGYYDTPTVEVVTAFQRHFRQAKVDGIADPSTLATLRKLLAARDQPAAPSQVPTAAKPEPNRENVEPGLFGHPLTREA